MYNKGNVYWDEELNFVNLKGGLDGEIQIQNPNFEAEKTQHLII